MLSKQILSVQHPFVKECVSLRNEGATRRNLSKVLVVGKKMVQELRAKLPLQVIACSPEADVVVSPEVLKKITGLPEPDGWAAVAPLPQAREVKAAQKTLILDGISDPGNLGTLLRSAWGLGWDAVVFTPDTVDPFNDKALRASKGAPFFLPFCTKTPEEITVSLKNVQLYAADLHGTPLHEVKPKKPLALVLSHEARGLSPWAAALGKKVSIPMHHDVDSLNVAVSGGILLYHLGGP